MISREVEFLNLVGFGFRDVDDAVGVLFAFAVTVSGEENAFDAASAGDFEDVADVFRVSGGAETDDDVVFASHDEELLSIAHDGIDVVCVCGGRQ